LIILQQFTFEQQIDNVGKINSPDCLPFLFCLFADDPLFHIFREIWGDEIKIRVRKIWANWPLFQQGWCGVTHNAHHQQRVYARIAQQYPSAARVEAHRINYRGGSSSIYTRASRHAGLSLQLWRTAMKLKI